MVRLEIAGRLTRDSEVKQLNNGGEVVNFAVAVNIPYKEIESAFFDCKCFPPWSRVVKRLKKGQPIHLIAIPKTEKWEKDGKNFSKQVWYPVSISVAPVSDEPSEARSSSAASAPPTEAGPEDDVPF